MGINVNNALAFAAVAGELTGVNSAMRGIAANGLMAANDMVNTALYGFARPAGAPPYCGFASSPAMDFAQQMPHFHGCPLGMPAGLPFGGAMLPPPSQMMGDPMQMIQQHLAMGLPLPPQLQQLLMSSDPRLRQMMMGGHSPVTATVDNASGGMDFDRAVRTLANEFERAKDGGGTISMDRLKTIANSPPGAGGFSPELQAAARYLVQNPDDFRKLETADQKKAGKWQREDGLVGLTDLTAILPNLKGGVGDKQLWDDVMSNANGLFNGRDAFHFDDIRRIAERGVYPDGSRATPQQQASAMALWNRKDLLMAADSADKAGPLQAGQLGDQKISARDVENMQRQATAGAQRKEFGPTLASVLTFGLLR